MALFTDGSIATQEDLRGYENAIYDVAATEGIDLPQKLLLARQELAVELTARLFRDAPEALGRVVVTPPLHLWHTFQSLVLVYRDAYNSHLNDRYQGKWREYERLAKWARTSLFDTGVGMVDRPIPRPALPRLSATAGNGAGAMYWAVTTWVTGSGEEGSPSEAAALAGAPGSVLVVAQSDGAPAGVAGWNVYVGLAPGEWRLQNATPLAPGAPWVMTEAELVDGRRPGGGQSPCSYLRPGRVLERW